MIFAELCINSKVRIRSFVIGLACYYCGMMSSVKDSTILVSWSSERPANAPEDFEEAAKQHDQFRRTLIYAGADLLQVPIVSHAFDSVFIKDSAVLVERPEGRKAFLANFRKQQRQIEQAQRSQGLRQLGFEVEEVAHHFFEGGDLEVLADKSLAFMGYGIRTDPLVKPQLQKFLGIEVVGLELMDKKLFHLDLAFSVLEDGTAFACKSAFSAEAWSKLMAIDNFKSLITVSAEEAAQFAMNWVEVGENIVLGNYVPSVQRELEYAGKNVLVTDLSSFHRSNGGAACLSARVQRLRSK